MVKKRLFAMLTIIMLVFALSGCPKDPPPTWQETNIEITGTWSGNTISFFYNGSPCTLTRNGGGNTLDGVWSGTFEGDTVRVTVSGSNWTMEVLDIDGEYFDYAKGTVTASGTDLTIRVTHVIDYNEGYGTSGPVGPIGPGGTQISTNGRLTITGLGAYNGQKIMAGATIGALRLIACESIMLHDNVGGVAGGAAYYTIKSVQATLKVYQGDDGQPFFTFTNYSGNDQDVQFSVDIYDSNYDVSARGSVIVNFTNGIGSGAFVPE